MARANGELGHRRWRVALTVLVCAALVATACRSEVTNETIEAAPVPTPAATAAAASGGDDAGDADDAGGAGDTGAGGADDAGGAGGAGDGGADDGAGGADDDADGAGDDADDTGGGTDGEASGRAETDAGIDDAEPAPTGQPTPEPVVVEQAPIEDLLALSSLAAVECPPNVAAAQVACAVATLPSDVFDPDPTAMVEIMTAFVDNGNPGGIGTVVFLQGGPGVSSTNQAPGFVGGPHDLLFVDHRGTGHSTPKLNCPEVDALWEAQFSDDPDVRLPDDDGETLQASYVACGERLADAGIDFDDFNTTAAATDIELIRRLRGEEPWSLWGISYGTRLGLTIMRDHPEGVRAAVLDSIVPFEVDFFGTIPEHAVRAIRQLDQACDDAACRDAHGDFYDTLAALTRRLDEEPAVIDVTRPGTGAVFPFRVDDAELLNLVFTQLYSTRLLRALPRQVARPDFGGLAEMVNTYVSRRDPTQLDLSIGLYYTTWCREEFPFYDETVDDDLLLGLEGDFGDAVADALSSDGIGAYCDAFPVAPAGPIENEPVVSDIPTLVFAGVFDPITPPAWSRQVADSLTNATYVELADHGHGMATACPAGLRVAFLRDPAGTIDTSCTGDVTGPTFD